MRSVGAASVGAVAGPLAELVPTATAGTGRSSLRRRRKQIEVAAALQHGGERPSAGPGARPAATLASAAVERCLVLRQQLTFEHPGLVRAHRSRSASATARSRRA